MSDDFNNEIVLTGLSKVLSSAGFLGVVAAAVGFVFLWPKNRAEGFKRIVISGVFSHYFGDTVFRTVLHIAPWLQPEEIRAACYLIAALPGWWLLGAFFRWLDKHDGQDIAEIAKDAANDLRTIGRKE